MALSCRVRRILAPRPALAQWKTNRKRAIPERDRAVLQLHAAPANNALGALYCAASLGEYLIAGSFLAAFVGSVTIIGLTLAKRRHSFRVKLS